MTATESAQRLLPLVQRKCLEYEPRIAQATGPVRWLVVAPTWHTLISDRVLLVILELVIVDIAASVAPWLPPIMELVVIPLLQRFGVAAEVQQLATEILDLIQRS